MKHVLATWPNDAKRARHIIDWLVELGAVTPYLDGDYYLTPAGKLVRVM